MKSILANGLKCFLIAWGLGDPLGEAESVQAKECNWISQYSYLHRCLHQLHPCYCTKLRPFFILSNVWLCPHRWLRYWHKTLAPPGRFGMRYFPWLTFVIGLKCGSFCGHVWSFSHVNMLWSTPSCYEVHLLPTCYELNLLFWVLFKKCFVYQQVCFVFWLLKGSLKQWRSWSHACIYVSKHTVYLTNLCQHWNSCLA